MTDIKEQIEKGKEIAQEENKPFQNKYNSFYAINPEAKPKEQFVFTIKLNEKERKLLEDCKKILEQEKDGTCLKQLAWIGAEVIHDQKIGYILQTVFENKRKNKRLGIGEFEA